MINTGEIDRKDTIFLRFIAIILILNSHLDIYYPIPYIGTGGAIGNSLFFMLSSFGLFLSGKNKPSTFAEYYEKRITRIYPAVWLVLVLLLLPILVYTNRIGQHDLLSYLGYFFYPPFWFIQALMCYYFLGFFLIKKYSDAKVLSVSIVILILYIILYTTCVDLSVYSIDNSPIDLFLYLGIFVYGIYMGAHNDEIKYKGYSDFILFAVSLFVIYGHKFLMLKGLYSQYQFIQHLFILPLLLSMMRISRSSLVKNKIMNTSYLAYPITWICSLTLEIYIVHTVLHRLKIYGNYEFPVNLIIFLVSTFAVSYIVCQLTHKAKILVKRAC